MKTAIRLIYHPLTYIILLASILRLYNLELNPPALNWDEVSHGYNAYSILTTGKDEWGVSFPTIFKAFGDYKLPVYIYATALSEFIFGLNAFAVRLPSALAGVGTVILTYLLATEIANKTKIKPLNSNKKLFAVMASLFTAIEPWSLFLSRGAFEANLALFLFTLAFYLFLKGLNSPKLLPYSGLAFGLTVWTYNSYRVFTPIFVVVMIWIFKNLLLKYSRRNNRSFAYALVVITILFVPMVYQLVNPVGQARYAWVEIIDEGAIAKIEESQNLGCSRLVCNKVNFFVRKFITNYASHFSGNFLFFRGGSQYQFSVPGWGLLYEVNAPFVLLGIVFILWNILRSIDETQSRSGRWWLVDKFHRNDLQLDYVGTWSRYWYLILAWFFLAPVPSSLTREAPHVLRSITFLPVSMLLSAAGIVVAINYLKEKNLIFQIVIFGYSLVLAGQFVTYIKTYNTDYRNNYSWSWQYGYKQVVEYVKTNYDSYDNILISKKYGEPHIFFLFYWPWDPARYRSDPNLNRFFQTNWFWVDSFDKFSFVNDWQINEQGKDSFEFFLESGIKVNCGAPVKCLLVTSPDNAPNGWIKLEMVEFLNNQPAFEIYDNTTN